LNPSCTCEDFQLRRQPCKHVAAVRLLLDRQIKGDPAPALPPRKTYRQQWPEYNAAQSREKDHFQDLLADLCAAIAEPPCKGGTKGGRPPAPLRDAVFTCIFKVYSTFSARRFACDLRESHRRGHITQETCLLTVPGNICGRLM